MALLENTPQNHKCPSGTAAVVKAHTHILPSLSHIAPWGRYFLPFTTDEIAHNCFLAEQRIFRNRILQCWEVWEINHLKVFPLSLTPTRLDPHSGNTFIDLTGVFCLQKVFSRQERQPVGARGQPNASWVLYNEENAPRIFFFLWSEIQK